MKTTYYKIQTFILAILLLCLPGQVRAMEYTGGEKASIKIWSLDNEGNPITGFKYEIINEKNEIIIADMTDTSFWEQDVEFGEYTINEIQRPEGYKANNPINVNLPYKDTNGNMLNVIKIYPKHLKLDSDEKPVYPEKPNKNDKPKKPEINSVKNPNTGDINISNKIVTLVGATILLFIVIRKNKELIKTNFNK